MTGEVRITRLLAAPRELVFAAFLDPVQVAGWWAPPGFAVAEVEIDPHAGGRIEFTMVAPDGGERYPVRFQILELAEPELIVLRADELPEAGIAEPTLTRIELAAVDGGTRLTLTQGPHTEAFEPQATAGWHGSLDRLAALLVERR